MRLCSLLILLLLLLSAIVDCSPRQTQKIYDGTVNHVEEIGNLEELKTTNLARYVGQRDDGTAEAALKTFEFLARFSIIDNESDCTVCGGKASLVKDTSAKFDHFVWRCAPCKKDKVASKTRIRSNSFFEGMKITPAQCIYLAANWLERPIMPVRDVANSFTMAPTTVYEFFNIFGDLSQQYAEREAVSGHFHFGGAGSVVEVDDTVMYRSNYVRGIRRTEFIFIVLFERTTGKIGMVRIPQRDTASLVSTIHQHVRPFTSVVSDSWNNFGGIQLIHHQYDTNYRQDQLNFVDSLDRTVNPHGIELSWATTKRNLKQFYESEPQIGGYLLVYLFQRCNDRKNKLNRLIVEMSHYRRPAGPAPNPQPQPPIVHIPNPPAPHIPQPPIVHIPPSHVPVIPQVPQPPIVNIPRPPVAHIPQPQPRPQSQPQNPSRPPKPTPAPSDRVLRGGRKNQQGGKK